ncbi:cerebellin-2 isoform X1 [Procambarus clarkii]|uniref:cerebellin-2 isoform X1 n=2 Tax=Procambarus clarkii TaxID=6728 RepID=UPI0037438A94
MVIARARVVFKMQNKISMLAVLAITVTVATAREISPTPVNVTKIDNSTDPEVPRLVTARQLIPPQFPPLPTLSQNVAFSVRKATESLNAVAHVHFLDVLSNVGSGWDPATSEFTTPYDGGYFFIFHAIGARNSDFTMALTRNGEYQVTAYGTRPTFEHGSNSVFLVLRRGEKISLVLQQGGIYEHPANEAYTTFSGFLLFHV